MAGGGCCLICSLTSMSSAAHAWLLTHTAPSAVWSLRLLFFDTHTVCVGLCEMGAFFLLLLLLLLCCGVQTPPSLSLYVSHTHTHTYTSEASWLLHKNEHVNFMGKRSRRGVWFRVEPAVTVRGSVGGEARVKRLPASHLGRASLKCSCFLFFFLYSQCSHVYQRSLACPVREKTVSTSRFCSRLQAVKAHFHSFVSLFYLTNKRSLSL